MPVALHVVVEARIVDRIGSTKINTIHWAGRLEFVVGSYRRFHGDRKAVNSG